MQRRLPIYLLLDCSESMVGEPLDAVNNGLTMLASSLRQDPTAIEVAAISVITFDSRARQMVPLTEVIDFSPPALHVGPGTSLGAALDLLGDCLKKEVRKTTETSKGDWKPIAFLLTDGVPTDDWQSAWKRFQKSSQSGLASFVAVGCGDDCDIELLKTLTSDVFLARDLTRENMAEFFRFVSDSVAMASVAIDLSKDVPLAPPGNLELGKDVKPTNRSGESTPSQYLLAARCSSNGEGYLMRYRRLQTRAGEYEAAGSYRVGTDYFGEASAAPSGQEIDKSKLIGYPSCPYCENPAWIVADGGDLICSRTGQTGGGKTQVMFVLDVTGSMQGEINGVKEGIREFVDTLRGQEHTEVEVGLIAFRDVGLKRYKKKPQLPTVLKFSSGVFTTDTEAFKAEVGRLSARGGGGNAEESSLDALVLASAQRFSSDAVRVLILITDQIPYERDGLDDDITLETTVTAMKEARIDQLHMVLPIEERKREPFAPLHDYIPGEIFDLDSGRKKSDAFREILKHIGTRIIKTQRG